MIKISKFLILFFISITSSLVYGQGGDWTGKYRLAFDPADPNSFFLQVVPDNNGVDPIINAGTAAYIIVPTGLTLTKTDVSGSWTISTLSSAGCGGTRQIIEASMETDFPAPTAPAYNFQAGVPVNLIKFTATSLCPALTEARMLVNNDGTVSDPCPEYAAPGAAENAIEIGGDTASWTGNLTTPANPLICPTVDAVDDTFTTPISSTTGGTTTSVLANDTNGTAPATTSNVTLTWLSTAPTGITLNSNGTIAVAAGTAAGYYTFTYRICSTFNTTVCDTAIATIFVDKDSDGDGILDADDLDDDNDGILDTPECGSPLLASTVNGLNTNSLSGSYISGIMTTNFTLTSASQVQITAGNPEPVKFNRFTGGVNSGILVYWDEGVVVPNTFDLVYTLQAPTNGKLKSLRISNNAPNSTYGAQNANKQITLTWPGGKPAILRDPLNEIINYPDGAIITSGTMLDYNSGGMQIQNSQWTLDIDMTSAAYPFEVNYHTVASVLTRFEGFAFLPMGCIDSDNDGITNDLDLDSDNDGCSDAIEGDENVTTSQLVTAGGTVTVGTGSTAANQNLGTTVDANGVPTIVNTGGAADVGSDQGQGLGSSQDATVNSCKMDAVNDINQTPVDVPVSGNVLTNDEIVSGTLAVQTATYLNASGAATNLPIGGTTPTTIYGYNTSGTLVEAGNMTLNADGTYTFAPATGFTGNVPVTYTGANGTATDTAVLDITVIPNSNSVLNDAPIANDDTAATEAGVTVTSNALLNDNDIENNTLTITGAVSSTGTAIPLATATVVSGTDANGNPVANAGTITLNANGTYSYTPAAGFTGNVNPITYTVSDGNGGTDTADINIAVYPNSGNNTFANDDADMAPLDVNMTGNVKTNDFDPEGHNTTVTEANASFAGVTTPITIGTATVIPNVGTLTLNSTGTYTFDPLPTFEGTLVVPYMICDGVATPACDQATLYLTSLDSAPFYDAINDINQTPINTPVSGNVITNDEPNTSITVQSAQYYTNTPGVLAVLTLGTATPIFDETGVAAGTITLNANGTYTYVPATGYTGTVPVMYTGANAGGVDDTAMLEITVIPAANTVDNDVPIAQNDTAATDAGSPVTSNVLANDSDPDNNTLTITGATNSTGTAIPLGTSTVVSGVDFAGNPVANAGTLTLNANGTYTYTPAAGFIGNLNPVTYTISDGNGGMDTAIIDIVVYPNTSNNTYANDDANSAPKGTTITETAANGVLANDNDPEGNTKTVTAASVTSVNGTATNIALTLGTATTIPNAGTLTLNADGSYTFVPLATFVGTVVVPYTMCDNGSPQACCSATVYLTSVETVLGACYNDANTAVAGVDTKHGISLLQRAGNDGDGNTLNDWPMTRKSAHTVLESNTKGFVITRMTTAQVTAIVSPQEGMMVYDTTAKCLKIYDGSAWSCFSTPACP